MVKIKSISLDGFKGHESTELEFGGINVITGKNNTGKTSILQGIDLAFNPGHLRDFGGEVDKIINAHCDTSTIDCHFTSHRGQSRLSEFSGEDVDRRTINLHSPDPEKVEDYLIELLSERLTGSQHPIIYSSIEQLEGEGTVDEFRRAADAAIRDSVADRGNEFIDNSMNVVISGSEYTYLYLDEAFRSLTDDIASRTLSEFVTEIDIELEEARREDLYHRIEHILSRVPFQRQGAGVFIETPPRIKGVRFISTFDITDVDIEDSEDYAVTLTEIEDYLKENGIVEGLKDFNIDQLVFEEGGDRYQLPYDFMGDGFKAIVGLLWELKKKDRESDVIMLEEPENHMHPGYIQELVKFLVNIADEAGVQLIITTHNHDFINEFFENQDLLNTEFLKEEFKLIQLQDDIAKTLDYSAADEELNELYLDLRGIK